jgi:uracil-DNA glycosylase
VDADQRSRANPFGMDEECTNCPALCEARERVLHGYGDVGADFLFVAERPSRGAERAGVPLAGEDDAPLRAALADLGFYGVGGDDGGGDPAAADDDPELVDAYLTHLTRCRHPDRGPTDEEVRECEPFLNAEVRMVNPEILVPVGERALRELGAEYTTTPAEEFALPEHHATRIRGRGFELFPTVAPERLDDERRATFVDAFRDLLASDYRQTKGRRRR